MAELRWTCTGTALTPPCGAHGTKDTGKDSAEAHVRATGHGTMTATTEGVLRRVGGGRDES